MIRKLDNAAWGFESSCLVCEPANERGLQIRFFYDDDRRQVTSEFSLGSALSGAPNYVHVGLVLAILDEAMAWATIAIGGVFALTKRTTTTFRCPVPTGRTHRVESTIGSQAGREMEARAVIFNTDAQQCAIAEAGLAVMSAEQARTAIGTEIRSSHAGYVRE